MMNNLIDMGRTVLRISGPDHRSFLNGLTTNSLPEGGEIKYSALLTPQGKYIADFFLIDDEGSLLIDVQNSHAALLSQRLNMYRLRANVEIEQTELSVSTGFEASPDAAFIDPRHAGLGWRYYGGPAGHRPYDLDAVRVQLVVGQTGIELHEDTYILEAGFERLNGVDFKKGCFVGQEIVARMKHKSVLRKGLKRVHIDGLTQVGQIITSKDKEAGKLYTRSHNHAIAFVRFDRTYEMETATAKVALDEGD